MSTNFTGVTFAQQHVTPADDAIIRRSILTDGILSGCDLGYSGHTLTMGMGQLMICGRQIRHAVSQNWAVAGASSGFARLLLSIDLARTSNAEEFDQVVDTIEYAEAADSFAPLTLEDINSTGTVYQMVVCTVSLGAEGITGIVSQAEASSPSLGDKSVLLVYAPAGSKVTCAKGNVIKQAVERDGLWRFNSLENGQWVITAALNGRQACVKKDITEFGVYRVTLSYRIIPAFTFGGDYEIVDDDDRPISDLEAWESDWNIKLKSSGDFVPTDMYSFDGRVDIFGIGGGGTAYYNTQEYGIERAKGAKPKSYYGEQISLGTLYQINIGAPAANNANQGGKTSGFGKSWAGAEKTGYLESLAFEEGTRAFDGTSRSPILYGGNMENAVAPPENTGKGSCNDLSESLYFNGSAGILIIRNARG